MSSCGGGDFDVATLDERQRVHYESQMEFLNGVLRDIFKTTFDEAFSEYEFVRKGDAVLLKVVSRVRDLTPALDIKLVGFQLKKKIGYRKGDLVLVLKETRDGKAS